MQNVLQTRYYNIGEREQGKHLVQIRSQTETSGISLPEINGIDKGIDPNVRPEKQVIKPVIEPEQKVYLKLNQMKPKVEQV